MAEKQERTKVMNELRGRLDMAQKHHAGAAKAVGSAFKSFDANPDESVVQIAEVSTRSTAALLSDPDSAIVLIAEKAQADGSAAHSLSVMTLALLLGKQARLPQDALRALGIAALLHDIGKSAINSSILRNTSRNKHEEAIYQTHCRVGYESALRAKSLTPPMLDAILHHHERIDGKGFPDGLSGKQIHVASRVVAIANRFDNLSNPVDPAPCAVTRRSAGHHVEQGTKCLRYRVAAVVRACHGGLSPRFSYFVERWPGRCRCRFGTHRGALESASDDL
jgi:HD-GYP domain-containing protein (c-di-GMP phosphodiesterase class II)